MADREEIVRRAIAALNESDWEALTNYIHPEMRLSQPLPDVGQTSYESYSGMYHGRREAVDLLRELAVKADGVQIDLRHAEEVDDDGLLYEFVWLIGPEDRRSAQLAWGLSRFKDDKVLSSSVFATEDAARAAIARGA